MVQDQNNSRKNLARSLRNGGYSYSEIQKFVSVPKTTLEYWLRDIKLSPEQLMRLEKKRAQASRVGLKKRMDNFSQTIDKIQASASKEIGSISKRELWLMGVLLFWKNQKGNDVTRGVSFVNGDPYFVKLFLRWTKEIGQLNEEEISCDILYGTSKKKAGAAEAVAAYWSGVTGLPPAHFSRIFRHNNKAQFGLLQIRVKASSMLARQLHGWIRGIQDNLDNE